ncbi:hypothetical protein AAHA92_23974 [Salvia divinorum]|uniref:Uncharacterized protein n=1 Tax=Salvia divinorum TaxID=28513 RepID=A0ABD1G5U7_SALDI
MRCFRNEQHSPAAQTATVPPAPGILPLERYRTCLPLQQRGCLALYRTSQCNTPSLRERMRSRHLLLNSPSQQPSQDVTEDLHEFYTHSGIQSFLQIGKQEQLLLLDSLLLAIEDLEISKNRHLIV